MVRATVGGVATKVILDTGSSDQVFTREVAVDIAGQSFPLHDAVAIPGPPPFAGWGVGGFLSPQHLHPTAWVVLTLTPSGYLGFTR